jgi:hypothetical protein
MIFLYKDWIENMMWENRNSYYLELYETYEKYGCYHKMIQTYSN